MPRAIFGTLMQQHTYILTVGGSYYICSFLNFTEISESVNSVATVFLSLTGCRRFHHDLSPYFYQSSVPHISHQQVNESPNDLQIYHDEATFFPLQI